MNRRASILLLLALAVFPAGAFRLRFPVVVLEQEAGGSEDYLTGLAHRWTFDSDLTDSVGSADGTGYGDAAVASGALSLDGTDDAMFVDRTTLVGKTNVTVCLWIQPGTASAFDFDVFVHRSHTSAHQIFWLDRISGTYTLAYLLTDWEAHSTGTQLGSTAISMGTATWYHLAITIDQGSGGVVTAYLDGVQEIQSTTAALDGTLRDWGTDYLRFGLDDGDNRDFNGLMDDIRIYDAVLTAAQIEQIYDATVGDHP